MIENKDSSEPNLEHLQEVQRNLTNALRLEGDPKKQAELLDKVTATRRDIERLEAQNSPKTTTPMPGDIPHPPGAPITQHPGGRVNSETESRATGRAGMGQPQGNTPRPSPFSDTPGYSAAGSAKQNTGGGVFTSLTVIALAALLAVVAVTWIIVARPGTDSTNTAGPDLSSEGLNDASSPAAPDAQSEDRAATFQSELSRIVATTPIIFQSNEIEVSAGHKRTLDKVAEAMSGYSDVPVKVLGFTDPAGGTDSNEALSLQRAENVKTYLVSKGVAGDVLSVEARGEAASSGSAKLANLERKVEFEVQAVTTTAAARKIAIVAPSATDDLAFTQSIIDAANIISDENGNIEVEVKDNVIVPAEAGAAIREFATNNFDLVIAHGSQYGSEVQAIAPDFPNVVFAWGTAADNFGLPNVYAYEAASEQGGYVLGAMSAILSENRSVGVVGPIEVGDAQRYVNGFKSGAAAAVAGVDVKVEYINSFSDTQLAAETANRQLGEGADVLSGTGQMVAGAIPIVKDNGGLWLGTQSSQAPLAPDRVVASQVYRWEIILRQILGELEAGKVSGRKYLATLANGGLVIEYNSGYPLAADVRERTDEIIEGIKSGAVQVN